MKKGGFLLIGCFFLLSLACGCSPEEVVSRVRLSGGQEASDNETPKQRVYMDKVTGTLQGFDGSNVTISASNGAYTFDVSEATVECSRGMISGDEISVIYEGQLNGSDTSGVQALKIVDELHAEDAMKEQTIQGFLTGLTENTVTFRDAEDRIYRCTGMGARIYFAGGMAAEMPVTVHYLGMLPEAEAGSGTAVSAPLVKIISVSDTEPLAVPDLSKVMITQTVNQDEAAGETGEQSGNAGSPDAADPEAGSPDAGGKPAGSVNQKKTVSVPVTSFPKIRGSLRGINMNLVRVLPSGASGDVQADISGIPIWFPGGTTEGIGFDIYYDGEILDQSTLAGAKLLYAVGDDPTGIRKEKLATVISGVVIGHTADTVTLRTSDEAVVYLRPAASSQGDQVSCEVGDEIRVTVNPTAGGTTNILEAYW